MPRVSRLFASALFLAFFFAFLPRTARSQENPYIVTYDQFLEEPRYSRSRIFLHLWNATGWQ